VNTYLRFKPVTNLFCHVGFIGQKIMEIENFDWRKVNLGEIVDNTKYPEPKDQIK